MSNPKISIISPVYNVEKYIHRCVDSIIAQTFTDWELILVDDGSTDTSGTICDQYASQDSRIRVIHKQNGGVSAARQTGLDASQGEYVIHADPDDWVEPTMLEELYAKAKAEDADMVICDYYTNSGNSQSYIMQFVSEDPYTTMRRILCGEGVLGSLWNKLIKRFVFLENDIRFYPNINFCEDSLVCVQILKNSDIKIGYLNRALYHYYINKQSITCTPKRELFINKMHFEDVVLEMLTDSNQIEILDRFILRRLQSYSYTIQYSDFSKEEIIKSLNRFPRQQCFGRCKRLFIDGYLLIVLRFRDSREFCKIITRLFKFMGVIQ